MKESGCQQTLIELGHLFGWKCAHFRSVRVTRKDGSVYWQTPVQGDGKGFPDTFMLQPEKGWRLVAEIKVGDNPTTPEQKQWLEWCERCGIPAYKWRLPRDWAEVEQVLRDGPEL